MAKNPLSTRITIGEIASELCIGKYAIYKALEAGQIPGFRLGNRWLVSRSEFWAWWNACGLPDAPAAKGE